MRFYFIRHGESEANTLHIISNFGWKHPLTALGRAQAEQVAERLRAERVTHLYSSPVMRAVQTAQILSTTLGVPFGVEEALRENDNGSLEGRSDAAAWGEYERAMQAWKAGDEAARIADGESLAELRQRFAGLVAKISADCSPNSRVVLVAHGGIYRAGLPGVLVNVDRWFSWAHALSHTGMVVAEVRRGGLMCVDWDGIKPEKESAAMQVDFQITAETTVTPELLEAWTRLMPQLSATRRAPLAQELAEILASRSVLFTARMVPDGRIVGSLTLAVFRTPTGLHAHIEDVVVDNAARGKGIGAALTETGLARARELGCEAVDLTSNPKRESANRLYLRLGFQRRETNVYRFDLKK